MHACMCTCSIWSRGATYDNYFVLNFNNTLSTLNYGIFGMVYFSATRNAHLNGLVNFDDRPFYRKLIAWATSTCLLRRAACSWRRDVRDLVINLDELVRELRHTVEKCWHCYTFTFRYDAYCIFDSCNIQAVHCGMAVSIMG